MAIQNTSKGWSRIFLVALLLWLILGAIDVGWARADRQPQGCDQAGHLLRARAYARALHPFSIGRFSREWRARIGLRGEYTYPPFYHVLTGALMAATIRPPMAATVVNVCFLGLLILSTLWIGERAFCSGVGLAAAALVALYPTVAQFQHEAFIDFALTGMTAWCIWTLLSTDSFRVRSASVIFGCSVGLALLLKEGIAIFLAAPVLYVLLRRWKELDRSRWLNLAIAVIVTLCVSSLWYGWHWRDVLANMQLNQRVAAIEGDPMPWTLQGAIFYPWMMACVQIGFFPFLFALFAAIFWIGKWSRQPTIFPHQDESRGIIVAWILGSLVILTFFILNKDIRYSLPVLPAIALLTCAPMAWMKRRITKGIWIGLLLCGLLPYYSYVMFAWPPLHRTIGFHTGNSYWLVWTDDYYFGAGPRQDDWHIPEMLAEMHRDFPDADRLHPIRFAVVPFLLRFNNNSIRLEGLERRIPVEIGQIGTDVSLVESNRILQYDFLFLKTGDLGLPFETSQAESIQQRVASNPNRFALKATYNMPDHSLGYFYRIVK